MKTATGLVLIPIGAVLAFAVKGHPGFLNIQVVGWILMIIGVIGIAIPRSGYGWLRRQVVTRRGPGPPGRRGQPEALPGLHRDQPGRGQHRRLLRCRSG